MDIISLILVIAGVWIVVIILPLWVLVLTVLSIKGLSDDPSNPDKFYLFTEVEPGRTKAVLRGGKVIRYLMNNPGHKFSQKGGDKTKDEYWEVVEETEEDRKEQVKNKKKERITPIQFFFGGLFWPVLWRKTFDWYKASVLRFTGHSFVGIYPWQKLHIYSFTRKMPALDDKGKPVTDKEGMSILESRLEPTDHVRARVFVWHVKGQAGETKEGLKVQVRGMANVRTVNPQKALFGADRWDTVLTSTILRNLASNIRTMKIEDVLMAENATLKDKLADDVKKESNEKLADFGLIIDNYQIVDFDAQLSPDDASALTATWRATKLKEAERIAGEGRGQGRAAEITMVAEAVRTAKEDGKRAQELEALIRQASEAGKSGGVVILGGQQADSGLNAAILAELKKLNNRK